MKKQIKFAKERIAYYEGFNFTNSVMEAQRLDTIKNYKEILKGAESYNKVAE
jgi:hypothetical protein